MRVDEDAVIVLRAACARGGMSLLVRVMTLSRTSSLRPLRLPLVFALVHWLVSLVMRLVLVACFRPPGGVAAGETVRLLSSGALADAAVALALATPLALYCLLKRRPLGKWRRRVVAGGVVVAWLVLTFLAVSEWYFFEEFQSRFNTVAVDYLVYPHEVFTNMWETYNLPAIVAGVAVAGGLLAWLTLRVGGFRVNEAASAPRRFAGAGAWLAVATGMLWLGGRGEATFSSERVVNELAGNGLASAVRAAWTRDLDYAHFYRTLDRREAFLAVRRALGGPDVTFPFPEPPALPAPDAAGRLDPSAEHAWLDAAAASLQRRVAGDPARPRLNVCVLVQESLGSEFWGALGRKKKSGRPDTLTPNLDRLAQTEGLLFDNVYADGNRTIRGLEAVFSSIPPLPGDSILARERSDDVETLARVLKRDSYQTLFVYGGRGTFDHISSYALRNGWDRLVQQWDFEKPTLTTAWGVSDEDAYARMLSEMRTMHASGQPFLVCNMSLSNHVPFNYPAGRIEEDPAAKSRKHAVKYCDWALNDFFAKAKAEPFWQDTIFVVVADHGARVYGSETIPLKSYEVPFLVLGPAVVKEPRRVSALGCQLDVAPTVLGLVGRPYDSMFFGRDLLKATDAATARCLMHHNRSIAIYRDGRQVVFGLNKSVEHWAGDPRVPAMVRLASADAAGEELEREGAAFFQVADELYCHELFRVRPVAHTFQFSSSASSAHHPATH